MTGRICVSSKPVELWGWFQWVTRVYFVQEFHFWGLFVHILSFCLIKVEIFNFSIQKYRKTGHNAWGWLLLSKESYQRVYIYFILFISLFYLYFMSDNISGYFRFYPMSTWCLLHVHLIYIWVYLRYISGLSHTYIRFYLKIYISVNPNFYFME